jgi:nucleoside-diphosphate-sugar epimerase
MKVGVTGGNGFIGSWVRDVAARAGHDVVSFDHRGRGWMLGDVRDATAVTEFAAHVDAVVHLAAVLGTQETVANPRPAAETNVLGALNVLEACRQYRLPVVNIAVGNWWMRNTYSTTKHCAERLVEQYRDELGVRAANVRVVNAYGPGQSAPVPFSSGKVRKIIPTFSCQSLAGLPVEVYGDGSQISDCVFVGDVARVLVAAVESLAAGAVPDQTVEVGPFDHHTVRDIAEMVIGEAAHITGVTVPVVELPMRPGEQVGEPVVAAAETCLQVGVDPFSFVSLDVGLAETVRAFAAEKGRSWQTP